MKLKSLGVLQVSKRVESNEGSHILVLDLRETEFQTHI